MSSSKLKRSVAAVFLPAALGLGVGLVASRSAAAEKAVGISLAEFKDLKPVLDIKRQPWTTIPWKYSITEARKLAVASGKPIFMVVNTGNCLGCT
jgi:hypothetical protein